MLIQNNSNTNFGNITKYKVRLQDCNSFINQVTQGIQGKLKKDIMFFNENPRHSELTYPITMKRTFSWAIQNLKNKGIDINYSMRLKKEEIMNAYLVEGEEDIKKIKNKTTSTRAILSGLPTAMKGSIQTSDMLPEKIDDHWSSDRYDILQNIVFSDKLSQKFEKILKKMDVKEVDYNPNKGL